MTTKTTTLTVDVHYDPEVTDPEGLASALDRLMETALSTPGIMDDYGNPRIDEFYVAPEPDSRQDRWAIYDPDWQTLLTTQTFSSYEDAAATAPSGIDVLIVKFTARTIGGSEDCDDEEDDDG